MKVRVRVKGQGQGQGQMQREGKSDVWAVIGLAVDVECSTFHNAHQGSEGRPS